MQHFNVRHLIVLFTSSKSFHIFSIDTDIQFETRYSGNYTRDKAHCCSPLIERGIFLLDWPIKPKLTIYYVP